MKPKGNRVSISILKIGEREVRDKQREKGRNGRRDRKQQARGKQQSGDCWQRIAASSLGGAAQKSRIGDAFNHRPTLTLSVRPDAIDPPLQQGILVPRSICPIYYPIPRILSALEASPPLLFLIDGPKTGRTPQPTRHRHSLSLANTTSHIYCYIHTILYISGRSADQNHGVEGLSEVTHLKKKQVPVSSHA